MIGRFFIRRADRKLAEEIRNNLFLLFTERSAQIVTNDESDYSFPRPFDLAVATVETPDLFLRFTQVRGDFFLCIALPNEHPKWGKMEDRIASTWSYERDLRELDWGAIDHFLADNWDGIKAALVSTPKSDLPLWKRLPKREPERR